jgi:hypothetical protein
MTKRENLLAKLENLFWIFLFINPVLDIMNGFYLNVIAGVTALDVESAASMGVTPSLVIRMLMLLIFAFYVLLAKDRLAIVSVLLLGITWLLSVISEYLSLRRLNLFTDMQYMARFGYNILLLFIFIHTFGGMWREGRVPLLARLDRLIAYTLIVLASSILISYLLGVGYSTYADRLGIRGSRGFFYAGNDITAVLALLLPVNLATIMCMDRRGFGFIKLLLLLLPGALTANSLLVIGSKTAFISVVAAYGILFVMAFIALFIKKEKKYLQGFLLALLAASAVFAILLICTRMSFLLTIINSFSVTGDIADKEGATAAIFSGRQFKLAEHWAAYKGGGALVWLFGMGRGSRNIILEMDVLEVLFYYGILGVFTMLWSYAAVGLQFILRVVKRLDIMGCALIIALAVSTGYLIMAGHILFSVTSGFYYSFTIIYSRVYLAENASELPLRLSLPGRK